MKWHYASKLPRKFVYKNITPYGFNKNQGEIQYMLMKKCREQTIISILEQAQIPNLLSRMHGYCKGR